MSTFIGSAALLKQIADLGNSQDALFAQPKPIPEPSGIKLDMTFDAPKLEEYGMTETPVARSRSQGQDDGAAALKQLGSLLKASQPKETAASVKDEAKREAGLAPAKTSAMAGADLRTEFLTEQFDLTKPFAEIKATKQYESLPFEERRRLGELWGDAWANEQVARAQAIAKSRGQVFNEKETRRMLSEARAQRLGEARKEVGDAPKYEFTNTDYWDGLVKGAKTGVGGLLMQFSDKDSDTAKMGAQMQIDANAVYNKNKSELTKDEERRVAFDTEMKRRENQRKVAAGELKADDLDDDGLTTAQGAELGWRIVKSGPLRMASESLASTVGPMIAGAGTALVTRSPVAAKGAYTTANVAAVVSEVAADVSETINGMDEKELSQSDSFRQLLDANGGDLAAAKQAFIIETAQDARAEAALLGAGAAMLPGGARVLKNKVLGKVLRGKGITAKDPVFKNIGNSAVGKTAANRSTASVTGNFAKGATTQFIEEGTEEGLTKVISNEALDDAGIETDLSQGVLTSAVAGGLLGAGIGGTASLSSTAKRGILKQEPTGGKGLLADEQTAPTSLVNAFGEIAGDLQGSGKKRGLLAKDAEGENKLVFNPANTAEEGSVLLGRNGMMRLREINDNTNNTLRAVVEDHNSRIVLGELIANGYRTGQAFDLANVLSESAGRLSTGNTDGFSASLDGVPFDFTVSKDGNITVSNKDASSEQFAGAQRFVQEKVQPAFAQMTPGLTKFFSRTAGWGAAPSTTAENAAPTTVDTTPSVAPTTVDSASVAAVAPELSSEQLQSVVQILQSSDSPATTRDALLAAPVAQTLSAAQVNQLSALRVTPPATTAAAPATTATTTAATTAATTAPDAPATTATTTAATTTAAPATTATSTALGEPLTDMPAGMLQALQNNDIAGALRQLEQSTENAFLKDLSKRLSKVLSGNTRVELVSPLYDETGEAQGQEVLGMASRDGKRILLNTGKGPVSLETFLHEAVHAATQQMLDTTTLPTQAQADAASALRALHGKAKDDTTLPMSDRARQDLGEFVAEVFTKPALQAAMRQKPYQMARSMWDYIKGTFARLLGVDNKNMLGATLGLADSLFAVPGTVRGIDPRIAQLKGDFVLQTDGENTMTPSGVQSQGSRQTGTLLRRMQDGETTVAPASPLRALGQGVNRAGRSLLRGDVGSASQTLKETASATGQILKSRVNEAFADAREPFLRWLDATGSESQDPRVAAIKQKIVDVASLAPNVRDNRLTLAAEQYGGKELETGLGELLKVAQSQDPEATSEGVIQKAGLAITAKYALYKNQLMLKALEGEAADLAAQVQEKTDSLSRAKAAQAASNTPQTRKALREAQEQLDGLEAGLKQKRADIAMRIEAINGKEDVANHKAPLAAGMNNAQARAFIKLAEDVWGPNGIDDVAKAVYRLNAYRVAMDLESGRVSVGDMALYSPELAALEPEAQTLVDLVRNTPDDQVDSAEVESAREAFISKLAETSTYVPTTGDNMDPSDATAGWFGAGTAAPNVRDDMRLKGRVGSVADDAINTTLQAVTKSASAAAWQQMGREFTNLYDALTPQERKAAGIEQGEVTAITRPGDNIIIDNKNALFYRIGNGKEIAALRRENVEQAGSLWRMLQIPTQWLAYGITRLNLAFGPVNMIRDVWDRSDVLATRKFFDADGNLIDSKAAAAQMKYLAPKILKDLTASALGKETYYGELLKEFEALGGGGSKYGEALKRDQVSLMRSIEAIGSTPLTTKLGLKQLERVIAQYNDVWDSVSALSAYDVLRKSGVPKQQAAAGVLDMMNFRLTGTVMPALKALYVFANPAVQGGKATLKALGTKEGRVRLAAYTTAAVLLVPMLRAMAGDDEETGKNRFDLLVDSMKERFIALPLGDKFVKIPFGFGLPSLGWRLGVHIDRVVRGEVDNIPKETYQVLVKALISLTTPFDVPETESLKGAVRTFSPTILKPVVNVVQNESNFGREIVQERFKDKNQFASEQGAPNTPAFYKEAASLVREWTGADFAPEQIRELWKGYMPLLQATFKIPNAGDIAEALVDAPAKEAAGRAADTPFVKRFVAGGNAYAVETTASELTNRGLELEKRENAAEAKGTPAVFTVAEQELKALYDNYVDEMTEFQRRNAALTRDGIPKGVDHPQRKALIAERRSTQAEFARRYVEMQQARR